MDFIEIVNRIFINKNLYADVPDEDKVAAFFIINRKFGKEYPEIARKFNYLSMDKASAIDMWFEHFKSVHKIPKWYWDPPDREKTGKKPKKSNYELVRKRYDMTDNDIKYLEKYYAEELKMEMKKLEKFEK